MEKAKVEMKKLEVGAKVEMKKLEVGAKVEMKKLDMESREYNGSNQYRMY